MDKSAWPPGPWHDEPDALDWVDEETGFRCRIRRNGAGNLFGYVGVPKGFSAYEKHYNDVDVRCHGGLTYSALDPETGLWLLGFDCGHSGDYVPCLGVLPNQRDMKDLYKDVSYVQAQVKKMCLQLFNPLEALAACQNPWAP